MMFGDIDATSSIPLLDASANAPFTQTFQNGKMLVTIIVHLLSQRPI
jgi:hypothetical protein